VRAFGAHARRVFIDGEASAGQLQGSSELQARAKLEVTGVVDARPGVRRAWSQVFQGHVRRRLSYWKCVELRPHYALILTPGRFMALMGAETGLRPQNVWEILKS